MSMNFSGSEEMLTIETVETCQDCGKENVWCYRWIFVFMSPPEMRSRCKNCLMAIITKVEQSKRKYSIGKGYPVMCICEKDCDHGK